MTRLESAVATFQVADVGATIRWYREYLGFRADVFPESEPHGWASMQRDGAEIMLLRINGYRKPDLASLRSEGYWDAYIRMGGVKELHETLAARCAAVTPLVKRFYGNLEFEMRDLNGYVLVFAEFTLEGTVPAEEIA